jgi:hypothetical protein
VNEAQNKAHRGGVGLPYLPETAKQNVAMTDQEKILICSTCQTHVRPALHWLDMRWK